MSNYWINIRNWLLKFLAHGHTVILNAQIDGKNGIEIGQNAKALLQNNTLRNFDTAITIKKQAMDAIRPRKDGDASP